MKALGLALLAFTAIAIVVGCSAGTPEGDATPPAGAAKAGAAGTAPGGGGSANQTKPSAE